MFTEVELKDAINELEGAKHSIQNCEKLAAIYTVLDHLYPDEPSEPKPVYQGYSRSSGTIQAVGESEFIKLVNGKPEQKVWPLINEFVEVVNVLNPRLYQNFLAKLENL